MSIDRVRTKIESLRNQYPSDFRVMLSADDIRKNKIDVLNSELHGPFGFEDIRFTEIIERALIAGKQVSLQSGGQNKVLILTAKSGGKLFDVQQSSKDEMVFDIQGKLEELHDRYIGRDGTPLLLGGLDSYIYQEKFAGIAKQYGFPKYKSYDLADKSILDEVKRRLEGGQTVIVIAWTQEDRMDVYVEPQHFSPQSSPYYSSAPTASSDSTNNGVSILGAIGTFILSSLFLGAIGGGFMGYCCFPIILAVVAYFVTPIVIKSMPTVIKSLKDFEWRRGMNDSQSLSLLSPLETEVQGLPDIKPYDAPTKFSFTLSNLIQLDETSVDSTISYLLSTNPEYKAEREQAKKEASRHLKTIFATRIWSPYEIKSFYWFSADKTDTYLKLSFDLYAIPAPVHMNYMVGRVHFETPLNALDGQIEKTWISIVSEEEIQENIEMLNGESEIMKYQIGNLQVFTHPKAEKMFEFPSFGHVEFEYPGTVRTLLFISCGQVRGNLRGGEDYYQAVARIYKSSDPQGNDENHIGKLYVDVYGHPGNIRFETKVERLEWHPDGSFDVIEPNGQRTRFKRPDGY